MNICELVSKNNYELFLQSIDGLDINYVDCDGRNALFFVKSAKILQELINRGVDIIYSVNDFSPLFRCIGAECVKLLVDYGVDVNKINHLGKNALFYTKHGSSAKMLIKMGININQTDKNNETALFEHVRSDNYIMVKALLNHGAEVNHINNRGENALFHFAGNNVRNTLLSHNANKYILNNYGELPRLDIFKDDDIDYMKLQMTHCLWNCEFIPVFDEYTRGMISTKTNKRIISLSDITSDNLSEALLVCEYLIYKLKLYNDQRANHYYTMGAKYIFFYKNFYNIFVEKVKTFLQCSTDSELMCMMDEII